MIDIARITEILNHLTIPKSDLTLGMENCVTQIVEKEDGVHIALVFPFPINHIAPELQLAIDTALKNVVGDMPIYVDIDIDIVKHKVQTGVQTIAGVKNIIAVASGKGGVGKSTTSANLAIALANMGARVGVLDADVYGPSQPTLFGVASQEPKQSSGKLIPIHTKKNDIQVMSIGFLVDTDQALVWRGPMVSQALQQLLFQSQWDDVDYLIVDLPPGTGDIQLTLSQKIPVTGSIVVTTPQDIALIDAKRAIDLFQKVNIPIFGVLENMSVHICSQCGHAEAIFGENGGKDLAKKLQVPLLGQLPLTLPIREAMDQGLVEDLQANNQQIANIYTDAAWALVKAIAKQTKDFSHRFPKIVVE